MIILDPILTIFESEVVEKVLESPIEFTRPPKDYIMKYGLNEAIVLEEMAFRQEVTNRSQSRKKRNDKLELYSVTKPLKRKRTFFTPIKSRQSHKYKMPTLENCFPWLTQPGIRKILLKLEHEKLIEISSTTRSKMIHTKSYFVPWKVVQKVKAGSRIKLLKKDCVSYGPAAALFLNYVQYSLRRLGVEAIELSPDRLKHLIPLSESTIRRKLKELVVADELLKDGSTTWYKLGKSNPLNSSHCGVAPRKVKYYNEIEATGFRFWAARDRKLAYTEQDVPELEQLVREIAIAFTDETAMEPTDIKPDEYHYFNEAAYICWKNDYDPAGYVAAQFNGDGDAETSFPRPWIPELLISDDAEQRYQDSEFYYGCLGLSN